MKHTSELRVKDYIEERPSQLFTQLLTEPLRRERLKNLNNALIICLDPDPNHANITPHNERPITKPIS